MRSHGRMVDRPGAREGQSKKDREFKRERVRMLENWKRDEQVQERERELEERDIRKGSHMCVSCSVYS